MDTPISNSTLNKTKNNMPGMESSSRAVIHSQKQKQKPTTIQFTTRTRIKNPYDLQLIQDIEEFEKGIPDTDRFNVDFSIIPNSEKILHELSCSQNSVKRSAYKMLRSPAPLTRQEFTEKMESRDLAHILNVRYIRDGLEQAKWMIDGQIKSLDFHINSKKAQLAKIQHFLPDIKKKHKKKQYLRKEQDILQKIDQLN